MTCHLTHWSPGVGPNAAKSEWEGVWRVGEGQGGPSGQLRLPWALPPRQPWRGGMASAPEPGAAPTGLRPQKGGASAATKKGLVTGRPGLARQAAILGHRKKQAGALCLGCVRK